MELSIELVFHSLVFQLNKYDVEITLYKDKVYEYDIDFPPR